MKQLLLLLLCVTSYFAANAQSVLNSDAYLAHIEKMDKNRCNMSQIKSVSIRS